MKVLCYGVRDVERTIFEELNREYGFELSLVSDYLKDEASAELARGHEAVLLRGNCWATRAVLEKYKSFGVRYLLTRTVGVNHIDRAAAEELGFVTGFVPAYSPNAIAELALTQAMMLLRHVAYTADRCSRRDFRVDAFMFSKEVRNCKVGIVGLGKIGFTAAKLFKGLGAEVLGYDLFPREGIGETVRQTDLDTLLRESDIVSVHVPFIKENGKLLTSSFVEKMKDGAILINTARGELQDLEALLDAVESGKLGGLGLDTLEGESDFFFRKAETPLSDRQAERAVSLYPRVLITPHIGSYTDEAAKNMIETSFENLKAAIESGRCTYPCP